MKIKMCTASIKTKACKVQQPVNNRFPRVKSSPLKIDQPIIGGPRDNGRDYIRTEPCRKQKSGDNNISTYILVRVEIEFSTISVHTCTEENVRVQRRRSQYRSWSFGKTGTRTAITLDRSAYCSCCCFVFTISMGLVRCVRDESNVPRSKIPSQTRGSICSEQTRERKYEHHAVYPGIARCMYNASAK